MSGYNEWELLAISEDIEVGDTVLAEDENGEAVDLVFVGVSKKGVKFLDESSEQRMFNPESLEEIGGYCILIGKSERQLRIKK